ncbi:hypothetical protein MalM25_34230 [Planctomycetes bacterium MalM25]|nr:hypothetical protein MalM25_34230 [Planctomycetes bacterium MalM25]
MAQDMTQIEAIRSQTLAQLQSVRANVKPTYWIDGQRVHWQQYVDSLQKTIDWCDQKMADLAPFEIASQGGA